MNNSQQQIYLDNAASTRLDNRVLEEMLPYMTEYYGNPSNESHMYGRGARAGINKARERVASLIGAHTNTILFTSGATESNNLVLQSLAGSLQNKGNHIITTAIEHKSILEPCKRLEKQGYVITYLPVNSNGLIDPDQLTSEIREDTIIISIGSVNNEIGVIQPISLFGGIAKERGKLFHTDVTQAVGTIDFNVIKASVDFASFSGHKIYGPKGVGVLYASDDVKSLLTSQILGGGQETGFRSGTENVPSIVGVGKAAQIIEREKVRDAKKITSLGNELWKILHIKLPGIKLNGSWECRIPGILNVNLPAVDAAELIDQTPEVAFSSGSACTSGDPEPSHVLLSLGITRKKARSSIRLSLGRFNNVNDVHGAANYITASVHRMIQESIISRSM